MFSLAIVWEDLGLNAHWKSVARLPLNIRLAGFTAGPPPSQREKKMIQCHSVVENTHTHTHTNSTLDTFFYQYV